MANYSGETIGFSCLDEDKDGKPRCPLASTVSVEVMDAGETTDLLAETTMTLQVLDQGTASAGSGKTLTDATQAWLLNQWMDAGLRISAGAGAGQERRVKSNTATVLTIDDKQVVNGAPVGAFSPAPDATSVYQLHRASYLQDWNSPASPAPQDVVAIFRARTSTGSKLSAEKLKFQLEAAKV